MTSSVVPEKVDVELECLLKDFEKGCIWRGEQKGRLGDSEEKAMCLLYSWNDVEILVKTRSNKRLLAKRVT